MFAIGENMMCTHWHAIRKIIRHGSPPFAINALENSIQAQIPLTGHAFAEDTDLTKFGTRYYNPALGRWCLLLCSSK